MKIKWKVSPAETGPYSSFHKRQWPSAHYCDEQESVAAMIVCDSSYSHRRAMSGDHPQLRIAVVNRSTEPRWNWEWSAKRYDTLNEAKAGVAEVLKAHPEYMPVKKE